MKKQYHFNTNAAKRLLAVCLCTAMAGTAAIPALAAETVEKSASSETYTYYFLAPDTFFDTNVGAPNSDVGVYPRLRIFYLLLTARFSRIFSFLRAAFK